MGLGVQLLGTLTADIPTETGNRVLILTVLQGCCKAAAECSCTLLVSACIAAIAWQLLAAA